MAKFSDLTPDQAAFLVCTVALLRARAYEQFRVIRYMGGATLALQLRDQDQTVSDHAPSADAFYAGLGQRGYLDVVWGNGLTFRLTRRALDYAAYARRRWLGRFWEDLSHDLGHDSTLRSRLLWSLLAIIISVCLAYIREIAAWLQPAAL